MAIDYKTAAEIRAERQDEITKQANLAAQMTPGRGIVSSMGRLGGMLGGQVMDAFGQYSPEEQKAMSLQSILDKRKGPPQTAEEANALVQELATAGHAKEARQAMLNYQKDAETSLKLQKMETEQNILENKADVNAHWTGVAMPNYINKYSQETLGLQGYEGPGLNTEGQVHKWLKDNVEDKSYRNQLWTQFRDAVKKEEKNWKVRNQTRDFDVAVTKKAVEDGSTETSDTGLKDPSIVQQEVRQPTTGAGYEAQPGLTQVDPERSQFRQFHQALEAKQQVKDRLDNVWGSFHSFVPEFLMSDAELEAENERDAVQDWIGTGGEGLDFFLANPKEIPKFEKDPIGYYKKHIAKKAKKKK